MLRWNLKPSCTNPNAVNCVVRQLKRMEAGERRKKVKGIDWVGKQIRGDV